MSIVVDSLLPVHAESATDGWPVCSRRGESWRQPPRMASVPAEITCPACRTILGLHTLPTKTDARPKSRSTHPDRFIPMISVHLQVSMRKASRPADAADVAQWVGEALKNPDVRDADAEYVVHSIDVTEDES